MTSQTGGAVAPMDAIISLLDDLIVRVNGQDRLTIIAAIDELKSQYQKRSEEYWGCMLYMMQNKPTIAELRQLNRDGVWWAYCMLEAICDARVTIESHPSAVVRSVVRDETSDGQTYMSSQYDVVEDGVLLCTIAWVGTEDEEPRFRVVGWQRTRDWCREDWGGKLPPWLRAGVYEFGSQRITIS